MIDLTDEQDESTNHRSKPSESYEENIQTRIQSFHRLLNNMSQIITSDHQKQNANIWRFVDAVSEIKATTEDELKLKQSVVDDGKKLIRKYRYQRTDNGEKNIESIRKIIQENINEPEPKVLRSKIIDFCTNNQVNDEDLLWCLESIRDTYTNIDDRHKMNGIIGCIEKQWNHYIKGKRFEPILKELEKRLDKNRDTKVITFEKYIKMLKSFFEKSFYRVDFDDKDILTLNNDMYNFYNNVAKLVQKLYSIIEANFQDSNTKKLRIALDTMQLNVVLGLKKRTKLAS